MVITEREKQVLCLLCFTDEYIGKKLFITKRTVKTHIINLLNKLCALNRRELLINAIKNNVVNLEDIITCKNERSE